MEEGEVEDDEAERLLWTLDELPDPYPDWARARNNERWLVAAPASPQALISKLYEMQRELVDD